MDSQWRHLYDWLEDQINHQVLGINDMFQSDLARVEYRASVSALQDTRLRMRTVDPSLPHAGCDDIATGIR